MARVSSRARSSWSRSTKRLPSRMARCRSNGGAWLSMTTSISSVPSARPALPADAQLEIEATTRVEIGVMPNRDIHVRQRTSRLPGLRADQHRSDYAIAVKRMTQPLQGRLIDRRNPRFLINDDHGSHGPRSTGSSPARPPSRPQIERRRVAGISSGIPRLM